MGYEERGKAYRIFDLQRLGKYDARTYDGFLNIFQIVSYGGRQHIVAVAARASSLKNDVTTRLKLARKLGLIELGAAIWSLPAVQRNYAGDRAAFEGQWREQSLFLPSYRCAQDDYFALSEPAEVEARVITGKQAFTKMHGAYQELDRERACKLVAQLRGSVPSQTYETLLSALSLRPGDEAWEVDVVQRRVDLPETTRKALIDARRGQGRFRTELEARWNGCCALTGLEVRAALRASHVMPWAEASDAERLDASNGLLLSATLDALFDKALISFDEAGGLLLSPCITAADRVRLGLASIEALAIDDRMRPFFDHHRRRFHAQQ
ncbi:HNH endonuclease signature motif containing protein [uncultured Methylobacterium sp.]|uniref:HNH endonuclease n=1 Tax=uncultured Methylobacterium sp. TaxID=157278 RepID=UPI002592B944|nr:HNH endonuclease signature motif containing protein [uncultured Methylobacterium sp.]